MDKKDVVKKLRFAANCMTKYSGKVQFYQGVNCRFSCNAVEKTCGEYYSREYSKLFASRCSMFLGDVRYGKLYIEDIEEGKDPDKSTQLHRALMIDFYAELIECGDLW